MLTFAEKDQFLKKLNGTAAAIEPQVAQAMAEWAQRISTQQRILVAKKTGKLAESTDWSFDDAPADAKLKTHGRSKRPKIGGHYLRVTLFTGSFDAFYARFLEFGTKRRKPGRYRDEKGKSRNAFGGHNATKARPYFWPVWNANKKDAKKAIAAAMRKAVKRLATKPH